MATAKKLPSGNYRVRVYDNMTKTTKSFTAPTKKEAERLASEWLSGNKPIIADKNLTVGEAVQQYIDSKEGVLSPSTIRGYDIIRRNAINAIRDISLKMIDEKALQIWISQNAQTYSAKSVKNQFTLIVSSLKQNKVYLDYDSICLPRVVKYVPDIPTEEQINKILHIVEGTNIELPVTMAVTLGMRQSEIAGIQWSDYDGQYLYIHATIVPDKHNQYVRKETTKSEASTRAVKVDEVLKERLDRAKVKSKSKYISTMRPTSVLAKFKRLCTANGLPVFTMHAQRHGNASLMLKEGVPDKYAMARLGQSSNNMIKNVYQHLYGDKQEEVAKEMSAKFKKIYENK